MADEYIRKQDVIEEIRKAENHAFNSFYKGLVKAHKIVADLPSADVAPVVHGEWEDKEVIHKRCIEEWQSARCSVCGKYHTTPYMYYFDDFKFCPQLRSKNERG